MKTLELFDQMGSLQLKALLSLHGEENDN